MKALKTRWQSGKELSKGCNICPLQEQAQVLLHWAAKSSGSDEWAPKNIPTSDKNTKDPQK